MTTNQTPRQSLNSIDQITRAAIGAGSHFFDRDTMRSFGCRVAPDVYVLPDGSAVFITSEKDRYGMAQAWDGRRRYTVRLAFFAPMRAEGFTITEPTPPGAASRLEAFGFFGTLAKARGFARKLKASGLSARDLVAPYYFTPKGSTQAPPCPVVA